MYLPGLVKFNGQFLSYAAENVFFLICNLLIPSRPFHTLPQNNKKYLNVRQVRQVLYTAVYIASPIVFNGRISHKCRPSTIKHESRKLIIV